MSKLYHGLCGVLFCGAAVGFAYGSYALGLWLAVGCIGCGARAMLDDRVKGVPGVTAAIERQRSEAHETAAGLMQVLDALSTRLAKIESRCEGMNTYLSALNTVRASPARVQSPLRPPSGAGPRG